MSCGVLKVGEALVVRIDPRRGACEHAWCERLLGRVRCPLAQPLTELCSHPQPPLVQTHTVTITAVSNSLSSGISTTEVPIVPTKTVTYESSKVGAPAPADLGGPGPGLHT